MPFHIVYHDPIVSLKLNPRLPLKDPLDRAVFCAHPACWNKGEWVPKLTWHDNPYLTNMALCNQHQGWCDLNYICEMNPMMPEMFRFNGIAMAEVKLDFKRWEETTVYKLQRRLNAHEYN